MKEQKRTRTEKMEIQLRSEHTGLSYVQTFKEAYQKVQRDPTIWKVSFSIQGTVASGVASGDSVDDIRCRMVYDPTSGKWENRPLTIQTHKPWVDQGVKPIPVPIREELIRAGFNL